MEDLELTEVCRLCLTKHEDMHLAIEVGAIDRLMDCAAVTIPADSLICDFCKNEVDKWYSFKQQVLKSVEVASYVEKLKKKTIAFEDSYVMIEECIIKTEVEEEIEQKPDVSEINKFINEQQSETVSRKKVRRSVNNTYKCESCDKVFYSKTGYLNHNRRLHSNKIKSQRHTIKKSEEPESSSLSQDKYQCDLCHKTFNSKMGMVWHKKLHSALKLDSSKTTLQFSCPHCPMAYEKKNSLIDHMKWKHNNLMKRSSQVLICDLCGKYCKTKSEFKSHTRTHKGEKQFKCGICSKSFVSMQNLVVHESNHSGTAAALAWRAVSEYI